MLQAGNRRVSNTCMDIKKGCTFRVSGLPTATAPEMVMNMKAFFTVVCYLNNGWIFLSQTFCVYVEVYLKCSDGITSRINVWKVRIPANKF